MESVLGHHYRLATSWIEEEQIKGSLAWAFGCRVYNVFKFFCNIVFHGKTFMMFTNTAPLYLLLIIALASRMVEAVTTIGLFR